MTTHYPLTPEQLRDLEEWASSNHGDRYRAVLRLIADLKAAQEERDSFVDDWSDLKSDINHEAGLPRDKTVAECYKVLIAERDGAISRNNSVERETIKRVLSDLIKIRDACQLEAVLTSDKRFEIATATIETYADKLRGFLQRGELQ